MTTQIYLNDKIRLLENEIVKINRGRYTDREKQYKIRHITDEYEDLKIKLKFEQKEKPAKAGRSFR